MRLQATLFQHFNILFNISFFFAIEKSVSFVNQLIFSLIEFMIFLSFLSVKALHFMLSYNDSFEFPVDLNFMLFFSDHNCPWWLLIVWCNFGLSAHFFCVRIYLGKILKF